VIYVLDTNAVSALMKGNPAVVERLAATEPAEVMRFDLISAELPRAEWTDSVSQTYGRVKATLERRGRRIEDLDAAIAAHALALGATLVTADLGHMTRVPGLRVEDWSS
jgi:tRNA(fMet)-specific endonuclease VapC